MEMVVFYFVLLLLSCICFVLSAFQVHTNKLNLIGLGLALWVVVPLIQTFQRL